MREGGEIVGCLAISHDVTQQRRTERELFAEERRRYLILDAMNEAYVANDMDGRVTAWNRAAETMFGWSADEAIGKRVMDLIIPVTDHAEFSEVMSHPSRHARRRSLRRAGGADRDPP